MRFLNRHGSGIGSTGVSDCYALPNRDRLEPSGHYVRISRIRVGNHCIGQDQDLITAALGNYDSQRRVPLSLQLHPDMSAMAAQSIATMSALEKQTYLVQRTLWAQISRKRCESSTSGSHQLWS